MIPAGLAPDRVAFDAEGGLWISCGKHLSMPTNLAFARPAHDHPVPA